MKYLFDHWEKIKQDLKERKLMIFLDFDGTLAPIVETPDKANIPVQTKQLLKQLSKLSSCQIVVISGRSLRDIKQKVGIDDIPYIGSHGLEIKGLHIIVSAETERILETIKNELKNKLSSIQGVILEDKGLVLSVHYRLLSEDGAKIVEKILLNVCQPYIEDRKIEIKFGKKVYEIRPSVDWDKGKAIFWVLSGRELADENQDILPICIGDDVTDEDAFLAIKEKGLAIYVGEPQKSHAQYYLRNTNEVADFLKQIYELKKDEKITKF